MQRFNQLIKTTGRNDLRDIAQHLGLPRQCSKWSEIDWVRVREQAIALGKQKQ